MAELLQYYQLSDIIIILVTVALAIKAIITFFEWVYNFFANIIHSKDKDENNYVTIINKQQQHDAQIQKMTKDMEEIYNMLKMLIESDKDDIKSDITAKYHYFMEKGYIDDYSLDCLDRRFDHYKEEGGNSFIHSLMSELHRLPKK